MQVFLVEDDEVDRALVEREFREKAPEYDIRCFTDGDELIMALQECRHPPRCILLDVGLPRVNGFEVLRYLEQSGQERPPVFVLSSSDMHAEILRERGCSPDGFINKPLAIENFKALVQ